MSADERRRAPFLRHITDVALESDQVDAIDLQELRRELARMHATNPTGWGERVEALEGHATRLWRGLEAVSRLVDEIRTRLEDEPEREALRKKGYL